jgi:FkbM family methyltransferase
MILSQCVGDTGKVYAFEPSKKIYNVLSDNIYKINKFEDNIKLINKGIGSKNETVKLYMDNNNP